MRKQEQQKFSLNSPFITVIIASIASLMGCANHVTVRLDNAKTAIGYLNSGLVSEGTVFIIDLSNPLLPTALNQSQFDLSKFPKQDPVLGDETESQSVSSFDLQYSGNISPVIQPKLEASIASQSIISLKNFQTDRAQDPESILNSPATVAWRSNVVDEFANSPQDLKRYRFLFISGATQADETNISFGAPQGKSGARFSLNIDGQSFTVTYTAQDSDKWSGKKFPAILEAHLFKLVPNPGGGTGYKFVYDLSGTVNITTALNHQK
jgi:hypothetical protein